VCREKKKRKSHPTRAWDKGKGKAEIERVPQSAFFAILQDALLLAQYFIRNRTGLEELLWRIPIPWSAECVAPGSVTWSARPHPCAAPLRLLPHKENRKISGG